MLDDLCGPGTPMAPADWHAAARRLDVPVEVLRAVAEVEGAGSGFLAPMPPETCRRPKILFEAHRFSALTGGRFDRSHPGISSRTWNRALYAGGAGEWGRLRQAAVLDVEPALQACSWGPFQILGSNFRHCGFADVWAFVRAHAADEAAALTAWVAFIADRGLADELRGAEWAEFARQYNGPRFRENRYDAKLAEAVQAWHRRLWADVPAERAEAAALQAALNLAGARPPLVVDGWIGPRTRAALSAVQARLGLPATGEVDDATRAVLGLAPAAEAVRAAEVAAIAASPSTAAAPAPSPVVAPAQAPAEPPASPSTEVPMPLPIAVAGGLALLQAALPAAAPSVAGWIADRVGGAGGEVLGAAAEAAIVAATGTDDPAEVGRRLQDPAVRADVARRLAELRVEALRIEAGRQADARRQTVELARVGSPLAYGAAAVSTVIMLLFAVVVVAELWGREIGDGSRRLLEYLLIAVGGYWLGSSRGSAEKTEMMRRPPG